MKKYLIEVKYGWSDFELENLPYRSIDEVEANDENEALELTKNRLDNSYLGGEKNIPIYYKILGYMEKKEGSVWDKDHKETLIEGKAK